MASVWEVAIKYRLDKLPVSPKDFFGAIEVAAMHVLSIKPVHIMATAELPPLHNDPFDRLLVAQAIQESLILLSADAQLAAYGGCVRGT